MDKDYKKVNKNEYDGFKPALKPKYSELIFVIFIVVFMCVLATLEFVKTFN